MTIDPNDPLARYKLKKLLKKIDELSARHTELITVYVPPGYELIKKIQQLQDEVGTASNIKSSSTRKNVTEALEKMIVLLKSIGKTPKNGLAAFAGNVAENEGQVEWFTEYIEPPMPLNQNLYRCDKKFVTEPLYEMAASDDIYGLVVLDRRDASLAVLRGKAFKIIAKTHSEVPGKFKAGGQCCLPDSLVQLNTGEIVEINDAEYPIKAVDLSNRNIIDTKIIDKWNVTKNEIYKITTKNPRMEITCSKDHLFFVRSDNIIEKPACDLTTNDYLIVPEIIEVDGLVQSIKQYSNGKIKTPKTINEPFAQIIGYYLGDGNVDDSRVCFSEGRKDVAESYLNKCKKLFNANTHIRFRKNKGYYEVRVYGRPLERLFREQFPKKEGIPLAILKSPKNVVASFLKGLFDAEGYVSNRVALGINDKLLARHIQIALLRFGIISSLQEYDNRRNPYSDKPRYTIELCGKESIIMFNKIIGFSAKDKHEKLVNLIKNKSTVDYTRQILATGREVRQIIEANGFKLHNLLKDIAPGGFFVNKRNTSKYAFKKQILDKLKKHKKIYQELKKIYDCQLIPAKINKIVKRNKKTKLIDISTQSANFIANCILTHNSAARFGRVREDSKREHFKKVAELMKDEFLNMPGLKGIIIGGPETTVVDFLNQEYITGDVQKKILGYKPLSYTEEFGIQELLDKASDLLGEAEISDEKKIMARFLETLQKKEKMAEYGYDAVKQKLEMGVVDVLLISESLDDQKIEELEDIAKKFSTTVKIISTDTREGVQLREIGKVAAILRYEVE